MRSARVHWFAGAALALAAGTASADFPLARQQIMLRATGALPVRLQRLLVQLAKPERIEIKPGQQPEDVIRAFCGGSYTNDYLTEVKNQNPALRLAPESMSRSIELPACIRSATNETIDVGPGETGASLTRQAFGVGPDDLVTLCEGKPPEIFSSCTLPALEAIRQFNKARPDWLEQLKPGQKLALPRVTRYTSIPIKDGISAAAAVTQIKDEATKSQAESGVAPISAVQAGGGFRLLSLLGPDNARLRDTGCQPQPDDPPGAWPFDAEALKTALEISRAEAVRRGLEIRPRVVRVVDTGAVGLGSYFPERSLSVNIRVSPDVRRDDGFGHFGVDASSSGDVTAFPDDPNRLHGTQVADYALGGHRFRSEYEKIYDMVRVTFFKVFAQDRGAFVVNDNVLVQSMARLKNYDNPAVVNFSVGAPDEVHTAAFEKEVLNARIANFLAVVAAGNSGDDLTTIPTYPAAYGGLGDGANHMIVVGASAPGPADAPYSNFSQDVVDLLAPGCRIPFKGPGGESAMLTGTSIAAPQVSFAAALVHALGVDDMSEVKIRLLASADFRPELRNRSRFGTVLNLPRSVMIFHDVVRPKAKAGGTALPRDIHGKWIRHPSLDICQDLDIPASRLVSVTPFGEGTGMRLRILHTATKGRLATPKECIPNKEPIDFTAADGSVFKLTWNEIQTLVPAQKDLPPPKP